MTNADETTRLQAQLAAHRERLATLLRQVALHGTAYAPPAQISGIAEARAAIAQLKAALRNAGVAVEDESGDVAAPDEVAGPVGAPARGVRQTIEGGDHNIQAVNSTVTVNQHGDKVGGDKFIGDKVAGNKYETHYHSPQPRPAIDLDRALALLDRLPLDTVPDPVPALPAGSRMPLRRNPLFVGRDADLRGLAKILKGGGVAAITTGIGGVGKTQLASEFVHRYGQYFAGSVFWLSFAESAGVEADIAACGMALELPGFAGLEFHDQVRQVRQVRQIWQEATPRLLVFDNCEDEELLNRYRPTSGGCRVLVSSRRQRWESSLGVRECRLGTLPRPESIALLRRFRPDLAEDDRDLDALALALGDLPLALHVAGSYLKRYQQAVNPAQYLEQLRSAPLQAFALRAAGTTPTAHERDVALTVAASYQRLNASAAIDALALALLARAACFAPSEPIPREWLEYTLDLDAIPADERTLAIEDALIRLDELGLSDAAEDGALRIHRLIAAFAREAGQDGAAQAAVEQVLTDTGNRQVNAGFPAHLLPILVHLRHAMTLADPRGDVLAGRLANALGRAEEMLTNYRAARPLYERALSIREQALGPQHPDTATSLNNLAGLLQGQGDYAAARRLYERALAICELRLGSDHPTTRTIRANLAALDAPPPTAA